MLKYYAKYNYNTRDKNFQVLNKILCAKVKVFSLYLLFPISIEKIGFLC